MHNINCCNSQDNEFGSAADFSGSRTACELECRGQIAHTLICVCIFCSVFFMKMHRNLLHQIKLAKKISLYKIYVTQIMQMLRMNIALATIHLSSMSMCNKQHYSFATSIATHFCFFSSVFYFSFLIYICVYIYIFVV